MCGSQDGGMGEDGHEHHERVSIGDVRHGGGGGAGDGDGQEEGAVVCIEGSYSIFSGSDIEPPLPAKKFLDTWNVVCPEDYQR